MTPPVPYLIIRSRGAVFWGCLELRAFNCVNSCQVGIIAAEYHTVLLPTISHAFHSSNALRSSLSLLLYPAAHSGGSTGGQGFTQPTVLYCSKFQVQSVVLAGDGGAEGANDAFAVTMEAERSFAMITIQYVELCLPILGCLFDFSFTSLLAANTEHM